MTAFVDGELREFADEAPENAYAHALLMLLDAGELDAGELSA